MICHKLKYKTLGVTHHLHHFRFKGDPLGKFRHGSPSPPDGASNIDLSMRYDTSTASLVCISYVRGYFSLPSEGH